jgi:hypothetical protein
MGATGGKIAGNYSGLNGGSVPVENPHPTALPALNTEQVIRHTQLIVLSIPIKKCAVQQGATTRAVESQRQGDSSMSLRAAVNLSRANPRAKAMFARMFGFSGPMTDPDFMEGIEQVADYYWRKQQQQLIDVTPTVADTDQADLFGGDQ